MVTKGIIHPSQKEPPANTFGSKTNLREESTEIDFCRSLARRAYHDHYAVRSLEPGMIQRKFSRNQQVILIIQG